MQSKTKNTVLSCSFRVLAFKTSDFIEQSSLKKKEQKNTMGHKEVETQGEDPDDNQPTKGSEMGDRAPGPSQAGWGPKGERNKKTLL